MANNSDQPSLLSKLAKFVRNPTKDWSELDLPEPDAPSGFDKTALKALIERKRQNDFVRKREFDQLRKLRSRGASADAGTQRPSVFQTSVETDPDGRAVTLKKIDEIEAQMSKQWWKGKLASAGAEGGHSGSQTGHHSETDSLPSDQGSASFQPTVAISKMADNAVFVATQMGPGVTLPPSSHPPMGRFGGADGVFSTSKLFAAEVTEEVVTDPELEEAAIRFANGDDRGAEAGLLAALRADTLPAPDLALVLLAALLDLYRVTDNRAGFDSALGEFALRLGDVQPRWEYVASSVAPQVGVAAAANVPEFLWNCPAELTEDAMEQLRVTLGSQPMPWHLGWSSLVRITDAALPLMDGLFSSLCDELVMLEFSGAESLVKALRGRTIKGDYGVDVRWWELLMNVMRTLQMIDEFELLALDYCLTYEVAPPAWVAARCECEVVSTTGDQPTASNQSTLASDVLQDTLPTMRRELIGEVLGDATRALAGDGTPLQPGGCIVVACEQLRRVDFSAAGSILNWVATRQAEGLQVEFRDVHRLTAVFFTVIGISDQARVIPRTM